MFACVSGSSLVYFANWPIDELRSLQVAAFIIINIITLKSKQDHTVAGAPAHNGSSAGRLAEEPATGGEISAPSEANCALGLALVAYLRPQVASAR